MATHVCMTAALCDEFCVRKGEMVPVTSTNGGSSDVHTLVSRTRATSYYYAGYVSLNFCIFGCRVACVQTRRARHRRPAVTTLRARSHTARRQSRRTRRRRRRWSATAGGAPFVCTPSRMTRNRTRGSRCWPGPVPTPPSDCGTSESLYRRHTTANAAIVLMVALR